MEERLIDQSNIYSRRFNAARGRHLGDQRFSMKLKCLAHFNQQND